jgi:hypothetical protein
LNLDQPVDYTVGGLGSPAIRDTSACLRTSYFIDRSPLTRTIPSGLDEVADHFQRHLRLLLAVRNGDVGTHDAEKTKLVYAVLNCRSRLVFRNDVLRAVL